MFKVELEIRIMRRLKALTNNRIPRDKWDMEWIESNRGIAFKGLHAQRISRYMEVIMSVSDIGTELSQSDLLDAASKAEIHTFGWPIGIVMSKDEYKPRPKSDGIVAEVKIPDRKSYDYWTLKKDGSFYLLKSLFEDDRKPGYIFFDTRIVRITEVLLYAIRLYSNLGAPVDSKINIRIKHVGLKNNILGVASSRRYLFTDRRATENEVYSEVETSLEQAKGDLLNLVNVFVKDLLIVFDFFELGEDVLKEIVESFVSGKVI